MQIDIKIYSSYVGKIIDKRSSNLNHRMVMGLNVGLHYIGLQLDIHSQLTIFPSPG